MNCPECGSEIKTIPAGVSKNTGRAYGAFQACSNRECTWKPMRMQKPLETPPTTLRTQSSSPMPTQKPQEINAEVLRSATKIVCQQMINGTEADPIQEVINTYSILLKELK
jgi:hypothetical protein